MFEPKTSEEIDKMSPEEFEKYSNDLAQSGVKPAELEGQNQELESGDKKPEEKKDDKAEIEEEDSKSKKSAESEGETEDEEEDDEEEDSDDSKKDDGKPSPAMPLSKYNKQKEKWDKKMAEKDKALAEVNAQIESLKSQLDEYNSKKEDLSDEDFKSYIDKTGADPEAMKELIKIISKKTALDPAIKKRLDAFEASQKETAEKVGFENDFNENIVTLIKAEDPNISPENLSRAKEKIRELAYSDKYLNYSLKDVFILNKSQFKYSSEKKKTVESSRPSSSRKDEVDYSEITPEDIDKMTPEEFDKYSDFMAKATGKERFKIDQQ